MKDTIIKWHDVRKDSTDIPTKTGIYFVILECPDAIRNDGKKPEGGIGIFIDEEYHEGEISYELEIRAFLEITDELANWVMVDCPEGAKFWWTEQTGSNYHERVVAWAEMPAIDANDIGV